LNSKKDFQGHRRIGGGIWYEEKGRVRYGCGGLEAVLGDFSTRSKKGAVEGMLSRGGLLSILAREHGGKFVQNLMKNPLNDS